jgi:hypothetical protein
MIQMMGDKFKVVAQKRWMLQQPVIETRCEICMLDGKYVRPAFCLELCKHHFWRLCGNGSNEKWQQMMFAPAIMFLGPAAAYEKRLGLLKDLYETKSISKALSNKQEAAKAKHMLKFDQQIFDVEQRMEYLLEMPASPERDELMAELHAELDALSQQEMVDIPFDGDSSDEESAAKKSGFVYILSNPTVSFNGQPILKIGYSGNPEKRAKQLSSASGVIADYKVEYTVKTDDMVRDEKEVHQRLDDHRVNDKREGFTCTLELAKKTLNDVTGVIEEPAGEPTAEDGAGGESSAQDGTLSVDELISLEKTKSEEAKAEEEHFKLKFEEDSQELDDVEEQISTPPLDNMFDGMTFKPGALYI